MKRLTTFGGALLLLSGLCFFPFASAAEEEGGEAAKTENKGDKTETVQSDPRKTVEAFLAAMKAGDTEKAAALVYVAPPRKRRSKKKGKKGEAGAGAAEAAPAATDNLEKKKALAQKIFEVIKDETVPEDKRKRTAIMLTNKKRVYLIKKDGRWTISSASAPKPRKPRKKKAAGGEGEGGAGGE